MALTPAQRKQKQIQREQDALKVLPDSSYPHLSTPFFEYLQDDGNWSSVELAFEMIGFVPPQFDDDRGPAEFAFDHCFVTDDDKEAAFAGRKGSIGRAEVMIDLLLYAASEFAMILNRYKLREIEARLKAIQSQELESEPERIAAFEEVVRIEKIRGALEKNVRRTFPAWEVKGI